MTRISWIFKDKLTPCDGKSSVHALRNDLREGLIIGCTHVPLYPINSVAYVNTIPNLSGLPIKTAKSF
ncbi:MAG: hypothetical protein FWG69_00600 [Oscillospiraceae bacterium]|nr:hypothetical protein [Oscillospiraceae bacterium]